MKVKGTNDGLLPVVMELEEYDRQYGSRIYPVMPAHNLSDYERAQHYKLSLSSAIGEDGLLVSGGFDKLDIRRPET